MLITYMREESTRFGDYTCGTGINLTSFWDLKVSDWENDKQKEIKIGSQ